MVSYSKKLSDQKLIRYRKHFQEKWRDFKKTCPKVSQKDLSYIAGFTEGEGYIGITKSFRKENGSPRYYPQISIANTHCNILLEIQKILGYGFISRVKVKTREKDRFSLRINSSFSLFHFLKILKPYWRLKKPQTEILEDFVNDWFKGISKYRARSRFRLSPLNLKKAESCYLKLKILNKKGKSL